MMFIYLVPSNTSRSRTTPEFFYSPHHASIGFPYCGQLGGSTGAAAQRLKGPSRADILPRTHPPHSTNTPNLHCLSSLGFSHLLIGMQTCLVALAPILPPDSRRSRYSCQLQKFLRKQREMLNNLTKILNIT